MKKLIYPKDAVQERQDSRYRSKADIQPSSHTLGMFCRNNEIFRLVRIIQDIDSTAELRRHKFIVMRRTFGNYLLSVDCVSHHTRFLYVVGGLTIRRHRFNIGFDINHNRLGGACTALLLFLKRYYVTQPNAARTYEENYDYPDGSTDIQTKHIPQPDFLNLNHFVDDNPSVFCDILSR